MECMHPPYEAKLSRPLQESPHRQTPSDKLPITSSALPEEEQSTFPSLNSTFDRPVVHDPYSYTPTPTRGPHHFPHHSMHMQHPPLNDQALAMKVLEQIWSSLSLEQANEETMSNVCIPVHPRVAMAWNQTIQTPNLPLRLESPPQNQTRRMNRGHIQVQWVVHPYQAQVGHRVA